MSIGPVMSESNSELHSVLVVGTGLIGTSIAIGLAGAGKNVFLSDLDSSALEIAQSKSGAKKWAGEQVDLAVVATPPATVSSVIKSLLIQLPNSVITDVASVKSAILADLSDVAVEDRARVVGGHPMAGREVSGAAAAQDRLFIDRPWVITSTSENTAQAVEVVVELAGLLGAVPIFRTPEHHDRAVALVSHAPQIVSSILARSLINADSDDVELAGQGIRDTIRIAGSDPVLWTDILAGNAQEVSAVVDGVADALKDFVSALREADSSKVSSLLNDGVKGKARLPGKHGSSAAGGEASLTVRTADRPGELARLFAAAANAHVNLEDVRIDHALGRMTGLVELTVSVEAKPILIEALTAEGFDVVI